MGDAQLYERWMAGDRHAGQDLARRHYGDLVRWLVRSGFRDYEDLAQSTWMTAQRSGTFSGTGSFEAWLRKIAESLARDRSRAAASRLPHDGDLVEELREASKASPSRVLQQVEIVEAVEDISHDGTRDTARWMIAGLSASEVAAETGVGVKTVLSRWRLAKARIRARLGCAA